MSLNKCCGLVEAERRVSEQLHASQKEATHEQTANKLPPPTHPKFTHSDGLLTLTPPNARLTDANTNKL